MSSLDQVLDKFVDFSADISNIIETYPVDVLLSLLKECNRRYHEEEHCGYV